MLLITPEIRVQIIHPQRALGFTSLMASNTFNVVSLVGFFLLIFSATQTRGCGLRLNDLSFLHIPAQGFGWSWGLKHVK